MIRAGGCHWTEDQDGNWDTDCGERFTFIDGGPVENGMAFCCYCGEMLIQAIYVDEEEPK